MTYDIRPDRSPPGCENQEAGIKTERISMMPKAPARHPGSVKFRIYHLSNPHSELSTFSL